MFASSNPSQDFIDNAMVVLESRITTNMKSQLDAPYTVEEVCDSLFCMAPWKALGPDGFHAGFFQKNWELVG